MSFLHTVKGKNGSYSTYKFTLGQWVGMHGAAVILYIFIYIFLIVAMPYLLLLPYLFDGSLERRNTTAILGMISSIYLLLDYHFGWIFWYFVGQAMPMDVNVGAAIGNLTMLTAYILLLIFENFVVTEASAKRNPFLLHLTLIITAIIISFQIASSGIKKIDHYNGLTSIHYLQQLYQNTAPKTDSTLPNSK